MESEELFAAVFVFGMLAGVFVILMAMRQRSQQLEMQHRERMAMIERGQVPFEAPHSVQRQITAGGRSTAAASRYMSLGIIVVAIGLGLMTIVSIAGGSPEAGVGVGGAIVILGLAFIANSLVSRNTVPDALPPVRRDDLS